MRVAVRDHLGGGMFGVDLSAKRPKQSSIVGTARHPFDHTTFRNFIKLRGGINMPIPRAH